MIIFFIAGILIIIAQILLACRSKWFLIGNILFFIIEILTIYVLDKKGMWRDDVGLITPMAIIISMFAQTVFSCMIALFMPEGFTRRRL